MTATDDAMIVAVVSPPGQVEGETEVVEKLCAAGLGRYHLRKPGWEQARVADWLERLPANCCSRVVLHGHHALAERFGVAGIHFRDKSDAGEVGDAGAGSRRAVPGGGLRSRSCHDPETLAQRLPEYDALLFGPVFPSLSKPGYGPVPAQALDRVRSILASDRGRRRARVLAIGGITSDRLPACSALGFDGVAIAGAVWHAADPVAAVASILGVAHARPGVAHLELPS
jgi:thiamine-phosphate pyrophosphorylase